MIVFSQVRPGSRISEGIHVGLAAYIVNPDFLSIWEIWRVVPENFGLAQERNYVVLASLLSFREVHAIDSRAICFQDYMSRRLANFEKQSAQEISPGFFYIAISSKAYVDVRCIGDIGPFKIHFAFDFLFDGNLVWKDH